MSKKRMPSRRRTGWRWAAFVAPVLAVLVLVIVATGIGDSGTEPDATETAPDFTLPDSAGGTVNLAEILAEGDALLYFSMGVGCDGCFLQIPEIAGQLEERGIVLVPIMVDRPGWLAAESIRLGVTTPIVVDADRRVSEAYGMLGQHGHGDVPSHSFALVRQNGELAWVRHYAEMFVPADRFFAELPA
jgi:peroxiredoxin